MRVEGGQPAPVTPLTVVEYPHGLGQQMEHVLLDEGRDATHPQVPVGNCQNCAYCKDCQAILAYGSNEELSKLCLLARLPCYFRLL